MRSIGKALLWIVGVGILLLIPTAGGKIFDAVTSELGNKEPAAIELKDIKDVPAAESDLAAAAEAKRKGIPEEDAEAAKERYMQGIKYFQETNYDKAREEWLAAAELDPYNQDVQKGLKRVEAVLAIPEPK